MARYLHGNIAVQCQEEGTMVKHWTLGELYDALDDFGARREDEIQSIEVKSLWRDEAVLELSRFRDPSGTDLHITFALKEKDDE